MKKRKEYHIKWIKAKLKENPDYFKEQYRKYVVGRLKDNPMLHQERYKKYKESKLNWKKNNKEYYAEAAKKYRVKYPEKIKARNIVNNRKLFFSLICEDCGSEKNLQKHHPDYSNPLQVKILCVGCHNKIHRIERR